MKHWSSLNSVIKFRKRVLGITVTKRAIFENCVHYYTMWGQIIGFSPFKIYPNDVMNYTAENICKWALENREMLIRWLRPHGGKSLLLNNELKKGPALLIFIPYNPLAEIHPLLDEVSEIIIFFLLQKY